MTKTRNKLLIKDNSGRQLLVGGDKQRQSPCEGQVKIDRACSFQSHVKLVDLLPRSLIKPTIVRYGVLRGVPYICFLLAPDFMSP